jgi:uncharacterized protein
LATLQRQALATEIGRLIPGFERVSYPAKVIEAYSVWGGISRYWELALEYPTTVAAIKELVLNPLGVLYREPQRLLSDQMRDTRQASSILSIIGQGCHRLSEIAARLGKPATSLTRPLAILVELGLIIREVPFEASPRDSKRTLYSIADPLLSFWLKFVEPNHSLIEAGLDDSLENVLLKQWPDYVGGAWEAMSRQSVAYLSIDGRRWKPASRWWGKAIDGTTMELDIVAHGINSDEHVLIGEAKRSCSAKDLSRLLSELQSKSLRCPIVKGKRITYALWIMKGVKSNENVFIANDVLDVLR